MQNPDNFYIDLGKWPHLVIHGQKVTEEQAKEFIIRTDKFWFSPKYAGNDYKRIRKYMDDSGLTALEEFTDKLPSVLNRIYVHDYVINEIKEMLGHIELEFLNTHFACTSYIGGPFGIVHPDGTVHFKSNIGRYPSLEKIQKELVSLATNFSFLNFEGSLFTESCSDHMEYLGCSFKVKNGNVEFVEEQLCPLGEDNFRSYFEKRMETRMKSIEDGYFDYEYGLDQSFYDEMASKIKKKIDTLDFNKVYEIVTSNMD